MFQQLQTSVSTMSDYMDSVPYENNNDLQQPSNNSQNHQTNQQAGSQQQEDQIESLQKTILRRQIAIAENQGRKRKFMKEIQKIQESNNQYQQQVDRLRAILKQKQPIIKKPRRKIIRKAKLSDGQIKDVVESFNSNIKISEIHRKTGISRKSIYAVLRKVEATNHDQKQHQNAL